MSPRMQERPSTASTCFSSPRIASRRSIRRPAACSPRSRRPAAAVSRAASGTKEREGEDSAQAQAGLRDGQRLRAPRRLHEHADEAALGKVPGARDILSAIVASMKDKGVDAKAADLPPALSLDEDSAALRAAG